MVKIQYLKTQSAEKKKEPNFYLCFYANGSCLKIYNDYSEEEMEKDIIHHMENRTDVEKKHEGNEVYVMSWNSGDNKKFMMSIDTNFNELANMLFSDFFSRLKRGN